MSDKGVSKVVVDGVEMDCDERIRCRYLVFTVVTDSTWDVGTAVFQWDGSDHSIMTIDPAIFHISASEVTKGNRSTR